MLKFDNISTASVEHQSLFFNAGFNYSTLKNMSVEGYVLDLANSNGVSGIWTGINAVIDNAQDYQIIYLNGVSFGSGKVNSISFSEDVDVRKKTYSADLSIMESGNLFNMTGDYYGFEFDSPSFIEEFNEDYNFQQKTNGGYAYNHSATIRFSSGGQGNDTIILAQALAKKMFTGANLGFAFYSGFTNKQGKRFFTERYNKIDGGCAFEESFDFDANSGNYSALYNNRYELAQDGLITVIEQGEIRGIENPNFEKAQLALNAEVGTAYSRAVDVFNIYAPSGANSLMSTPTTKQFSYNLFDNVIGYNVTFNNDIANSGLFFWNYDTSAERSAGISKISENGQLIGHTNTQREGFNIAKEAFLGVKSGISARVAQYYNQYVGTGVLFLETKSENYAPINAEVNYNYQFSDEPVLVGVGGVKRIYVEQTTVKPLYSYNIFDVPNAGQVPQLSYAGSQGEKSLQIRLVGEYNVPLNTYLSNAVTVANTEVPAGTNVRIVAANYTFSPNEKAVEVQLRWLYNNFVTPSPSV